MGEITDPGALAQLNATGDDYIKTLDPSRASLVKALAEGRQALPAGYSMRSPLGQQLLADVAQYDPTFDAANLPARIAARKAFTSGKQGQNITSFNTAIGHLGTLAQSAEALNNTGSIPLLSTTINATKNAVSTGSGNPEVTNFNVAKQAVVDELERAFKGTGGNVHEIKQWEETLNSSRSPAQLRGAIQKAASLLHSRIGSMQDSYNAAMGTTDQPLPMLNQHASDALSHFDSKDYLDKGYGAIATPTSPPSNGGGGPAPGGSVPGETPPGGPIDPGGGGDIGFVNGGQPASALTKEQQAAYDAFNAANPKATADQLRAFGSSLGINLSNADDIVKARDAGSGVAAGATARYEAQAEHPDAIGSFVDNAANAVTFGTLPKVGAGLSALTSKIEGDPRSLGDLYGSQLQANNETIGNTLSDHSIAALGGNIAGFVAGDAALGAIPGVAALASRIPSAARPLAGDALYGAAYGAGSSDSLSDVPRNALGGAALSATGGVLGRGVLRTAAAAASPVANAAVQRLTQAGVTLTPGQILGAGGGKLGSVVKATEDRAAGFPLVGDVINSARRGGVEDFNRAALNDALAPIGGTAADVGHAGIADAQQQVSDAYTRAIGAMRAVPDAQFAQDIRSINGNLTGLSQDHRAAFHEIMDRDIQPYVRGGTQMSGEELQAVKQGLDKEIAHYQGDNSSPQDRRLAERLSDARDAFMDMAGRTTPDAAADYQAANRAFAMLSRVQGAAAKSKDGVFTPQMFRTAVTKRGYGTTTANVARGSALMQQLSTDASTILPSSVPDSGTAGRAALGMIGGKLAAGSSGAALGGAAGYEQSGVTGALAGAALGAAAFSRPGLRMTQGVLAGSRGRTFNTLGDVLRRNAEIGGAVGVPLLLERRSN